MEQVGQNLAANVQEYIVNIDLSQAQFNADLLFEEANKLGMDFGDLQEYGFDTKSSNCGGNACINKDSFKNLDDALSKSRKFSYKLMDEGANLYKRAQCHPQFRKHVTPHV